MVSPLQTWQHPEHKRLWIALGGLSVLVHIGILGLSLPYLLTLMTTGGSRPEAAPPPIELVLVDEAALAKDAVRPEATPADNTSTVSDPASPPEAAPSPAPDPPASAVSVPAEDSPPESPAEADSDTSRETSSPRPQSATPSNPSPPADPPSEAETADTNPPPTRAETQTEDPADELPILDGIADLPDPSEGTAGEESPQTSFAVSIVSHGPPPAEQQYDLKDTFPSVPEGVSAAVPLQRQAACEWFNFFPQQWTYRVAVNTDGSIGQMTLLSETGDVREGEAIACLIERSLSLIPAEQGGEAVYDDNLILTLVITRQ